MTVAVVLSTVFRGLTEVHVLSDSDVSFKCFSLPVYISTVLQGCQQLKTNAKQRAILKFLARLAHMRRGAHQTLVRTAEGSAADSLLHQYEDPRTSRDGRRVKD